LAEDWGLRIAKENLPLHCEVWGGGLVNPEFFPVFGEEGFV